MTSLRAVIFDVDGTLADTERDGHRPAFNAAFALHGIDIDWDAERYGELLAITGGRRRIAHDLRSRGYGDKADALASAVHVTKTRLFRDAILSGAISARPGVRELIDELRADGIRVAVATTGQRAWVEPLLEELLGENVVDVTVAGDDVRRLKPHPDAYVRALRDLELEPQSALAVEDSDVGLRSALAARLTAVVVSNEYTETQDFDGAATVRTDFDGAEPLTPAECRAIHAASHRTW